MADAAHDDWNPGLSSDIPAHLKPLITLYRADNATLSYAEAKEAADFCGLPVVRCSPSAPNVC